MVCQPPRNRLNRVKITYCATVALDLLSINALSKRRRDTMKWFKYSDGFVMLGNVWRGEYGERVSRFIAKSALAKIGYTVYC